MIAGQIQPQSAGFAAPTKYYQFTTILEHVIDCFHTIVTDETNPYHPPLAWLTRKQPKPPDEELFVDLHDECSKQAYNYAASSSGADSVQLGTSVRARLEKCPQQQRQEIVSRSRDGCAPLFAACKNGLTRIVKYLLDVCGADIEQRGRYEALEDHHVHSVTPIWVAAVSGHLDTVKLLIDRGANVNSISDTGSTPLRSVCFLCKDDDGGGASGDQLEEYDNFRNDDDEYGFGGREPEEGGGDKGDIYMKIVCLLAENGADPKRPNYNGGTCLINSLHNYHLASYILSRGVDVNASDHQAKTALHYAIQQNRVAVVKLLLANGANPLLETRDRDDALGLSCIGGHEEIFEHLVSNYNYDRQRISDSYKLLGSSILEIHYDLTRVRKYWTKALELAGGEASRAGASALASRASFKNQPADCDTRRSRAFCGMAEFSSESRLQSLAVDDFRIQSLLISERILGLDHRETIQRLLYRGTFYINALRPNRCLDLWIYALKLRLDSDSIFHFESIFAAQAITKLFLDLFNQHQQVRFIDVHDVLQLLAGRLNECEQHLSVRPRSCLHEDIYDLLLNMIVKLLLIMRCVRPQSHAELALADRLVSKLAKLNPRTSNGCSLLHICVHPNIFEGDIYRSLQIASALASARESRPLAATARQDTAALQQQRPSNNFRFSNLLTGDVSWNESGVDSLNQRQANDSLGRARCRSLVEPSALVVQLIEHLIGAGLDVDLTNREGTSALQAVCLANSIRAADKRRIVALLVGRGAHVDRRAATPEQDERIRQALRECDIKPLGFVTLKCLAARRVSELRLAFDRTMLASSLNESLAIH